MKHNIVDKSVIDEMLMKSNITKMEDASIRDITKTANLIEKHTGISFIRMEMGVPGIKPHPIGTAAEIRALESGVAQFYPMLEGYSGLSLEASKFIKNFMDIDIEPGSIIPTVGGMQGSYVAFMATTACHTGRDTVLFIDPGFPVQKTQLEVMGRPYETFDIYEFRGEKLRAKLESYLQKGNIASIVYSNPNNPAWICLTEEELKIIAELADKYDVIVIEDLAYFAMDFRKDLSKPGLPPFQPTIAKYTKNYIFIISSSKLFSYAGQRLGLVCISDALFHRKYEGLKKRFNADELGYTIVYKIIYTLSSGTAHSPQYALAAIFKAANEGKMNITKDASEYRDRAAAMKKIFLDAGFSLVYDKDGEEAIGDGFYFTISYPGFSGAELCKELMFYGISSIPLKTTGSQCEGLRVCVSQIGMELMSTLKERVERFKSDH